VALPDCIATALTTASHQTDFRSPPPYQAVQALDPFSMDRFLTILPELTQSGRLGRILEMLNEAVCHADADTLRHPIPAIAALRDLDFLISSAHHISTGSYKEVFGLEMLLEDLGRWADHTPRGCNFTYGLCNPADDRMRRFTTTDEEPHFIRAIQTGTGQLDKILLALDAMTAMRIDDTSFLANASQLAAWFSHMTRANTAMLRIMPPAVFTRQIVVFFGPLDINGRTYPGITGAQNHNCAIDYLLFGADASNPTYLEYASGNLVALRPFHKRLLRGSLTRLEEESLIGRIAADLRRKDLDVEVATASLRHLDQFLTAILSFRAVHRRLAVAQLPMRREQKGSGGFDLALLDLLIHYTREARTRVRTMQPVATKDHGPVWASRFTRRQVG
jgi:hypothetical protein